MSDGKAHSLLSPSASHRWIQCTPSARLTENYQDQGSAYASEGTLAHSIAEAKLRYHLGISNNLLGCDDAEMDEHTDNYVAFVMEQIKALTEPKIYIEQKVDCSRYVPECKGTCDALIISNGVLHIIDLKYGRGVKVDAENNDQLRIYALGALEMFGYLYDIKVVRMSIFQPRLGNCSTWEVFKEDIENWAEETLKPAAELAWNGEGTYKAGEHCQFCKAKAECRERAKENLALASYDFTEPPLLENDEITVILGKIDELVSWASDVKDYALTEALKGVKFNGWKIVEGRSIRKYTDETAVAEAVNEIGLDPYEHKVLGITAMTALLGKKRFEEVLGGFIEKPLGKPTLVSQSDKRQEININTAADDFADLIENQEEV
ncbi:MAG: nuclease [Clostridiales bacterium GWF2_38_85]|nr:MAG: nuclease [Clostridiales bacterium GWF2_38_85]HBL84720.1 DUF2800 domain-containing protein [Clostridiales bacterium]